MLFPFFFSNLVAHPVGASSSRMRRFETGKRGLPHSWQINCVLSDEGKQGGPGM